MRWKKRVIIPAISLLFIAAVCIWYVNDYYHADENVLESLQEKDSVSVTELPDGFYLDGPEDDTALIFYPAGCEGGIYRISSAVVGTGRTGDGLFPCQNAV